MEDLFEAEVFGRVVGAGEGDVGAPGIAQHELAAGVGEGIGAEDGGEWTFTFEVGLYLSSHARWVHHAHDSRDGMSGDEPMRQTEVELIASIALMLMVKTLLRG